MGKVGRPFSDVKIGKVKLWQLPRRILPRPPSLEQALEVLDYFYMEAGLLAAYDSNYPLVEPRELIPSFDAPLIEYRNLPAFSLVILDREISYQDEGFQFDRLVPEGRPPDPGLAARNRQVLRWRMPRDRVPEAERIVGRKGLTAFDRYVRLLPYLFEMDRGHVLARDQENFFCLAGIFASFPSDLDGEIKRFGRAIGKFSSGDNQAYEEHRHFVYRFLMEQMGFAICGERHTSAALFSRRLMRRREHFAVKVLGQSDRTITTLTSQGVRRGLPRVEKVALVQARGCTREGNQRLTEGGFFVDQERRVVLLKVHYQQHAYHRDNVLEERAMSVLGQEVIHPRTGQRLELDVLGLGQDRLLRLNDIVRGEYEGTIVFHEREQVQGTADLASRLKFLCAWLDKHRSLVAEYSPGNFETVLKVLNSFLDDPALREDLERQAELREELKRGLSELRLAHRMRLLEKLVQTRTDGSGRKLQHVQLLIILIHVLGSEGPELSQNYPRHLRKLLNICRRELESPYIKRRYLAHPPHNALERHLVGEYKLLARLVHRFASQNPH